jgi:hypothetical protein
VEVPIILLAGCWELQPMPRKSQCQLPQLLASLGRPTDLVAEKENRDTVLDLG